MALSQGSSVSWSDIRNLFDRVNAERHRLLSEDVSNKAASPTRGSTVLASTPSTLRTLTAGAISGNQFARTDLSTTLTAINALGVPSRGSLLTISQLSSLASFLSTIEAYNPKITTGTANSFSRFGFNSAFGSGFTSFNTRFGSGFTSFNTRFGTGFTSFNTAFGTGFSGFNSAFGTGFSGFRAASGFSGFFTCGSHCVGAAFDFDLNFSNFRTTARGTFNSRFGTSGTFFSRFTRTGTFFSRFTRTGTFNARFTRTGTFNARFTRTLLFSAFGAGFNNFNTAFGAGFSGFNSAFGAGFGGFNSAFGSGFGGFNSAFGSGFSGGYVCGYCGTVCTSFSNGFSAYCFSFTAASGTFNSRFGSGGGTFNSAFGTGGGTFNSAFGTGGGTFNSAFGIGGGTFNSAFGTGCPSGFYASFVYSFSAFNAGGFCPAEFCTNFCAASFFNTL